MDTILDLTGINESMYGYYIVTKIYDMRDTFYFSDDKKEYDSLILNKKILNYIDEINFIYLKNINVDKIQELTKVGNLLNFQVYLDINNNDDTITITGKNLNPIYLKIINN